MTSKNSRRPRTICIWSLVAVFVGCLSAPLVAGPNTAGQKAIRITVPTRLRIVHQKDDWRVVPSGTKRIRLSFRDGFGTGLISQVSNRQNGKTIDGKWCVETPGDPASFTVLLSHSELADKDHLYYTVSLVEADAPIDWPVSPYYKVLWSRTFKVTSE